MRDDNGRPQHWLGVQLDITELKGVEDELRVARDELELRVAERTAELEEANALMALEIGERRRAEADLRAAEHRYRLLAEQIPAVTYIWEPDPPGGAEHQNYTSPRIEQLLGYTIDEWHATADFWMSRLHPDDRTSVLAASLRSESTGEPFAMEYRYLHKDGHIVWVADQALLIERQDGRPRLFQGVMIDVTGRKEAENAAAESELRYRNLTEQVPGVIYTAELHPTQRGYRLRYVSPQLTEIFGYGPEDWATTENWLTTVHPEDRERVRAIDEASPRRTDSRSSTGSSIATAPSDGSATRPTSWRGMRSADRDPGARRGHDGRPQDRPGASRGPRAVPLAGRGHPGHHLPRARQPGGAGRDSIRLHQPADRADPRVHPRRGDERPRTSSSGRCTRRTCRASGRPTRGPSRRASRSTRSSDS